MCIVSTVHSMVMLYRSAGRYSTGALYWDYAYYLVCSTLLSLSLWDGEEKVGCGVGFGGLEVPAEGG